jgi:hypothetical protein
MIRTHLLTTVILAALAMSAAVAEPPAIRGQALVRYADLDLSRPADARTFLERLADAAQKACGGRAQIALAGPAAEPLARKVFQACQKEALAQAVTGVRAPLVQKLFAEANGAALALR